MPSFSPFDRFHKGIASLENKVVFHVPSSSRNCNPGEDKCRGGGKYVGDFHYALLDWGSQNRERRQWATADNIIQLNQQVNANDIRNFLLNNQDQREAYIAVVGRLPIGVG